MPHTAHLDTENPLQQAWNGETRHRIRDLDVKYINYQAADDKEGSGGVSR